MMKSKLLGIFLIICITACTQLNGDPYVFYAPNKSKSANQTEDVEVFRLGIDSKIVTLQAKIEELMAANESYKDINDDLVRLQKLKQSTTFLPNNKYSGLQQPWSSVDLIESGDRIEKGDVFSMYINRAYFRYLSDIGNSSEVVAIFEFDEGLGEDKIITKVIGPENNIPDETSSPFFNRLIYGPKKLEGAKLSVKVTLLEFDADENHKTISVLDLIGDAQKTLSIADPVTATEIEAAKVIAKTLLSFNADDNIFTFSQDFTTDSKAGPDAMILGTGNWVGIKREVCPMLHCYGQFWEQAGPWDGGKNFLATGLSIVVEAVVAIPIAFVKVFSDTPNNESSRPFEINNDAAIPIAVSGNQILVFDHQSRSPAIYNKDENEDEEYDAFNDKTWMSFSFYKGGDDSAWQKLQLLSSNEQALLNEMKLAKQNQFNQKDYSEILDDLKQQYLLESDWVQILKPVNNKFVETNEVDFQFMIKPDIVLTSTTLNVLNSDKEILSNISGKTFIQTDLDQLNSRVFDWLPDDQSLPAGSYFVRLTMVDSNSNSKVQDFSFSVESDEG